MGGRVGGRTGRTSGTARFDVAEAYDHHAGELFGFALNALGDRGAAEDVVQEVFTRAWRSRDGFDPARSSLRTWLFAIARNLVVDSHRARARRVRLVTVDDDTREPAVASPDAQVEARMQVIEALARLSVEQRQVVTAVHLAGRTYAELSAETGTSVATLRTRMHYGLRAMRSAMDETGWSDHERA